MVHQNSSDSYGVPRVRHDARLAADGSPAERDGSGLIPTPLGAAGNGRSALYIVLLLTLSWALAYMVVMRDAGPRSDTTAPDRPAAGRPVVGAGGS